MIVYWMKTMRGRQYVESDSQSGVLRLHRGRQLLKAKQESVKQSEAPGPMRAQIIFVFSDRRRINGDEDVPNETGLRYTASKSVESFEEDALFRTGVLVGD